MYCFVVSALIFLFCRFPRGTLGQTIIADYVASALEESDPQEPFPTVSYSSNEISLEMLMSYLHSRCQSTSDDPFQANHALRFRCWSLNKVMSMQIKVQVNQQLMRGKVAQTAARMKLNRSSFPQPPISGCPPVRVKPAQKPRKIGLGWPRCYFLSC